MPEQEDAPVELGRGVRIPAHALHEIEDPVSGEWVERTLRELREDLADYLDPGERLVAIYTGFGTPFGGAGNGLYAFGATDRRFVLLDQTGRFEEVDYDVVTSIDRDAGVHSFEVDTSKWREIGLSVGALALFGVLANVTEQLLFALGLLGALFATAYFGNRHRNQTRRVDVPYEDVIVRTPTSTETSHEVEAEADHWLGTLDVDVRTEHSERYVLRQWMRPEELAEYDALNFGDLESFATGGLVSEPDELEVKLSRIRREHR